MIGQLHYRSLHNTYQFRHQIVDQSVPSHDFVLHIDPLVSYTFSRRPGNLKHATAKVLDQLRQQYHKIRLFYSGGIDSHFVLHHCLINSIPIDEIYSVVKTPFKDPVLMALDESVNSAQPFLKQVADQLAGTDIHTPVLDHDFFNQFYSSNDFWRYSYQMYLGEPSRVCNIIDGLNLDSDGVCNLVGIDTPFVFWEQGTWQFCFVDQQFITEHVSKQSQCVHSISLQHPEFVEAYVNTIVDQMEQYPDYQTRFSWANVLQSRSKFIQQMIPELQAINGQTWGLRLPKSAGVPAPEQCSFMEKTLHANFRSFMHWPHAVQEQPAWLDRWMHATDWDWVERCHKFGGVFSDRFVLHD